MLRTYGPDCDGSVIDPAKGDIPPGATWIDLLEPTREEEKLVERAVGLDVPTRDEMKEIEPSSRLFERGEAIYMTLSTLFGVEEGRPAAEPIAFVLSANRLITVRYTSPKPFRLFADHVRREPELARDALTVLIRLLDTIIDRLADELEEAGTAIEHVSDKIFRREEGRRIPAVRLEALLTGIGRLQSLLARIRETAVSSSRVIGFLAASSRLRGKGPEHDHVLSLAADVGSLIDHSAFLASNLTFLLDASLGLISVEQNAALKVFSVAAVIFLPPTLVAGIYGMNFEHMPELHWLAGYPWAISLIVISAVLPYWIFKRKGWL
jgi:magnesium transporter